MNISADQWEKRKQNTLSFYGNKMPYKEKQFNHSFELPEYFKEMIGNKDSVSIANIGSGMFSAIGDTWPTALVYIYASDILADEFNAMLKKKHIYSIIPVERQDMTELTYDDNQFDIVHCVNAIDHCYNPMEALLEMYRVCKPGGWIYLCHYVDNAKYENYSGFHLWNITPIGMDCKIWSGDEEFYLSKVISSFSNSILIAQGDLRPKIVCKLRKT